MARSSENKPLRYGERGQKIIVPLQEGVKGTRAEDRGTKPGTVVQQPPTQGGCGLEAAPPPPPPPPPTEPK
jgi:hypothetical protein